MINYVSNCFEGEPKWIPTQNVIEPYLYPNEFYKYRKINQSHY